MSLKLTSIVTPYQSILYKFTSKCKYIVDEECRRTHNWRTKWLQSTPYMCDGSYQTPLWPPVKCGNIFFPNSTCFIIEHIINF